MQQVLCATQSHSPQAIHPPKATPLEVSVQKDEGRRQKEGRGVGRKLIEEKDAGIKDTWEYLSKGGFKKEGIYKLLHFKFVEVPNQWGKYELEKEYINTKLIKDFIK